MSLVLFVSKSIQCNSEDRMSIHSCDRKLFFFICAFFFLVGCRTFTVASVDKKKSDELVTSNQHEQQSKNSKNLTLASASTQDKAFVVAKKNDEQDEIKCSPKVTTKVIYKSISVEGKQVVGALEMIGFDTLGIELEARIDTGATTSSLSASNVQKFERDGKEWVSFVLYNAQGKSVTVERQLARTVIIKRHGEEALDRPVVKLQMTIGKVSMLAEFSLTNRSKFTYPVLIGRNVLTDLIIVDVSHEHIASEKNGVRQGGK